jgi:hypothetical protein
MITYSCKANQYFYCIFVVVERERARARARVRERERERERERVMIIIECITCIGIPSKSTAGSGGRGISRYNRPALSR